jgi:CRP/FNR family cyclic AMP-dependent transcriptional regulator
MHFDISKFPLFEGIDGKSLASIEKLMTIRDYIKDDVVIQEKSVGNEIYILLKGVVLIQKALTLDASDEDTNKNKALIHLRSEYYPFFGEFAIIEENAKRTATVIADEDCTMGVFKRDDLLAFLDQDHESGYYIYRNISRVLGTRLKKSNHDVMKLTTALALILED